MVSQNFSFWSLNADELREKAGRDVNRFHNLSTIGMAKWDFYRKEQMLVDKIQQLDALESDQQLLLLLLGVNRETKKVLVVDDDKKPFLESVLLSVDQNVLLGKERLFQVPRFWTFRAEKTHMLLESLERMKASGLVYYFLRLSTIHEMLVRALTQSVQSLRREVGTAGDIEGEASVAAGLSDSIIMEGILLLCYGFACSALGFTLELIWRSGIDGVVIRWSSNVAVLLHGFTNIFVFAPHFRRRPTRTEQT